MYTIVGIKRHDYVSKRDGKRKLGTTLYMSYEMSNMEGTAVLEEYINNEYCDTSGLEVGDVIRLFYNRWKKVEGFELVGTVEGR